MGASKSTFSSKEYASLLLQLRNEIKSEDLDQIKFILCHEKIIKPKDSDRIKTVDSLLNLVKEKKLLQENNVDGFLLICEFAEHTAAASILRDYKRIRDKASGVSHADDKLHQSFGRMDDAGDSGHTPASTETNISHKTVRPSYPSKEAARIEGSTTDFNEPDTTNRMQTSDTQSKPTASRKADYHKAKTILTSSLRKGEIEPLLSHFPGIPRARMDDITTGNQLLDALEVAGYISESNVEPLVVALTASGLSALADPFLQTVPVDSSLKAPLERVIKLLKLWYKSLVSRLAIAPWLEEMHLDQFFVRLSIAHTRRKAFNRNTLDSFLGILQLGGYRTVLLGDAGIGKSTLSLKVVNDWEKGKTELSKFRLVLFLRIRHMSSKSTSFVEAITASLPSSEAIDPEVIEKFLKEYPEKALILVDGFDELPAHLLNTPLHFDLLAIIKREKFSEVILYLTSRTSAMAKLNSKRTTWDHFFDNILHIEGFSSETARAFVAKWFGDSNSDVGSHLLANLQDNGLLDHAGTHPLLLTLFCSFVQVNLDMNLSSIPPTVTGLFANVMTSYEFHLTKKIKEVEEKYVPYLQAVLDEKHDTLLCLGKIAWKSLLEGEVLYWTLEVFRKQCSVKVLEHALNLGILKLDTNQLTPQNRSYISLEDMMEGGEDTVTFPHKLYQEFLAGYYLAHGKSDDIIKSLQMLKHNTHKIKSLEFPLRFACGLKPSLALRVMEVAVTSSYMLMIQCLHECCKGNGAPEDLNASALQELLCSNNSLDVVGNIEEKPVLTMFRVATQMKIPLRLELRCTGRTPGYVRDVLGEAAPMVTKLYIYYNGISAFSMLPSVTRFFPHLTFFGVKECAFPDGPADSSAVFEDFLHCCLTYALSLRNIAFFRCKNVPDIVRESNVTLRGLLRSRQDVTVYLDYSWFLDRTTFRWRKL